MADPTWRDVAQGTQLVADLAVGGLEAGEREQHMLERVSALTGSQVGLLFRGHVVSGPNPLRISHCHHHGLSDWQQELLASYVAVNGQDDPLVKPCMSIGPGAAEARLRQELISDKEFRRHPHFELCREIDVDARLMVTQRLPGTRVTNLTLHRSQGERPFDERERALMAAIGPALLTLMQWPSMPVGGFLRESDGTVLDLRGVQRTNAVQSFGFTPRECEVAHLVCRGLSNKEIGVELGISAETVKRHVSHLLRKAHAASRAELAFTLRELGWEYPV